MLLLHVSPKGIVTDYLRSAVAFALRPAAESPNAPLSP